MNTLSAWLESASGQRTPIQGSCFLGRSASCEVVLADTKISRQHALVQAQNENEFWLIDLGSANGTYLNGKRVGQPCRLGDGDSISVAGFTFGFHCPRATAQRRPGSTSTDATIHEIRTQECWLLVGDIQGSTLLVRRVPAEEAPRVSGTWLASCRQILDAHRGTINKFLGDGFFAYWPASMPPGSVVEALLALKDLQVKDQPPFRIVLHYGQVSLGGPASLGEEGLSGNEVNFVFRMEKLAGVLGVPRLLSEAARVKLTSLLPVANQGHHTLSGFSGEFAFFSF